MAKQLTEYTPRLNLMGRPPDYPWHEWLNGGIWEITQGVDFFCKMRSMEIAIRRTAAMYCDIPMSVHRKDAQTFVIKPRDLGKKDAPQ
jgi:hypothetical protein